MNPAPAMRGVRRALLSLAVLVAALLLAELAVRGWLRVRGAPYDRAQVETRLLQLQSPIRQFLPGGSPDQRSSGRPRPVLNPYWASDDEPDIGGVFAYFESGRREGDYTVLVTGGSVAAYFAIWEGGSVAAELGRDPRLAGRRVVVLNGAHAAHKQPQQQNRVALLIAMGCPIDAVLAIDGFNEVVGPLDNVREKRHPAWPGAPSWFAALPRNRDSSVERTAGLVELVSVRNQGAWVVDTCLRHGLHRSALLGTLAIRRLNALGARRNRLQEIVSRVGTSEPERERREESGPVYSGSPQDALALGVRIWRECSRSIHQLCEPRGIAYLHVLQPALHDEGSKPMSAEELRIQDPFPEWTRAAREGYPLLRAAGLELAEEGVPFLDATRVFDGIEETVYSDPCHFGERGGELLRHLVVPRLLREVR